MTHDVVDSHDEIEPHADTVVELDPDQIPDTDIVFECPYCGKSHAIDRRGANLVIACTACRRTITVPKLSDLQEENTPVKKTGAPIIVKKTRVPIILKKASASTSVQKTGVSTAFPKLDAPIVVKKASAPPTVQKTGISAMTKVFVSLAGLAAVAAAAMLLCSLWSSDRPKCFKGTAVFYTSAVSKRDVAKLGAYLVESGFANGDEKDVELHKNRETYEFRMLAEDEKTIPNSEAFVANMSLALGGAHVEVHFCDEDFHTILIMATQR